MGCSSSAIVETQILKSPQAPKLSSNALNDEDKIDLQVSDSSSIQFSHFLEKSAASNMNGEETYINNLVRPITAIIPNSATVSVVAVSSISFLSCGTLNLQAPQQKLSLAEIKYFKKLCTASKLSYSAIDLDEAIKYSKEEGLEADKIEIYEVQSTKAVIMDLLVPHPEGPMLSTVVSFRGTASKEDVWLDLEAAVHDTFISSEGNVAIGQVADGFLTAYNRIRTTNLVSDALERARKNPGGLFITGHSLGGALATLMMVDIRTSFGDAVKIRVITFGSPRVLSHEVAKQAASMNIEHYRCVNHGDPIPSLPFSIMGFTHSGKAIYFNKSSCGWELEENADFSNALDEVLGDFHDGAAHFLAGEVGYLTNMQKHEDLNAE